MLVATGFFLFPFSSEMSRRSFSDSQQMTHNQIYQNRSTYEGRKCTCWRQFIRKVWELRDCTVVLRLWDTHKYKLVLSTLVTFCIFCLESIYNKLYRTAHLQSIIMPDKCAQTSHVTRASRRHGWGKENQSGRHFSDKAPLLRPL